MKCQDCGRRDSLIHLSEIRDGEIVSTWLCPSCAAARQLPGFTAGDSEFREPVGANDASSLASFLSHDIDSESLFDTPDEPLVCANCGFSLQDYRQQNRLGCAHCYRVLASVLQPIMTRYHGRCLHLGRTPTGLTGGSTILVELTRQRVELERAIQVEDFESAARIRDLIQELEKDRDLQRPGL